MPQVCKGDEDRADKQFVGKGVKVEAKGTAELEPSRYISIQAVRYTCHDEKDKGEKKEVLAGRAE